MRWRYPAPARECGFLQIEKYFSKQKIDVTGQIHYFFNQWLKRREAVDIKWQFNNI